MTKTLEPDVVAWRATCLTWLSVGAVTGVGACALGRAAFASSSASQYHFEAGFAFVFAVALAATALGLQGGHFLTTATSLLGVHLALGLGFLAAPHDANPALRHTFTLWSSFTVAAFAALNRDLVIASRKACARVRGGRAASARHLRAP